MPKPFERLEVGGTHQFTWQASTAPSSLSFAIRTASETLVFSAAAVQSGGGNWYVFATVPDSFGLYPAALRFRWTATSSVHTTQSGPFLTDGVFEAIKTKAYAPGRK